MWKLLINEKLYIKNWNRIYKLWVYKLIRKRNGCQKEKHSHLHMTKTRERWRISSFNEHNHLKTKQKKSFLHIGGVPGLPSLGHDDVGHGHLVEHHGGELVPRAPEVLLPGAQQRAALEHQPTGVGVGDPGVRRHPPRLLRRRRRRHVGLQRAVVVDGLPVAEDEVDAAPDVAVVEVVAALEVAQRVLEVGVVMGKVRGFFHKPSQPLNIFK